MQRILNHDDKDGNTHYLSEDDDERTICGIYLDPISTTYTSKLPITCKKCIKLVEQAYENQIAMMEAKKDV